MVRIWPKLYDNDKTLPIEPAQKFYNDKQGMRKLAKIKEDIGKILGKLPRTTQIPLQGNGMAATSKSNSPTNGILGARFRILQNLKIWFLKTTQLKCNEVGI